MFFKGLFMHESSFKHHFVYTDTILQLFIQNFMSQIIIRKMKLIKKREML